VVRVTLARQCVRRSAARSGSTSRLLHPAACPADCQRVQLCWRRSWPPDRTSPNATSIDKDALAPCDRTEVRSAFLRRIAMCAYANNPVRIFTRTGMVPIRRRHYCPHPLRAPGRAPCAAAGTVVVPTASNGCAATPPASSWYARNPQSPPAATTACVRPQLPQHSGRDRSVCARGNGSRNPPFGRRIRLDRCTSRLSPRQSQFGTTPSAFLWSLGYGMFAAKGIRLLWTIRVRSTAQRGRSSECPLWSVTTVTMIRSPIAWPTRSTAGAPRRDPRRAG
jgi:hypothetical protein